MDNFWDYNVWGGLILVSVLLSSLLVGNVIKKTVPFLRGSLIPTSVIAGAVLLAISGIYKLITKDSFFDSAMFGGNGIANLEVITYHTLALGFIASTLKRTKKKLTKKRSVEIFNTGVTTVATYLIQGIVGLGITLILSLLVSGFFAASGVLLPFGYGQGTGQAMNYGNIYEVDFGFAGGKSFGLAIAALGFISSAIGGVTHLNIRKRNGKLVYSKNEESKLDPADLQCENEIPMQESVDKMTIQIALVAVAYIATYGLMTLIGNLFTGMKTLIYGFNFLIGVICAMGVKMIINLLHRTGVMKKEYTNNFLLTRISNFFFDIMVVAGIAAIRLETLASYWAILLLLGVVGAVVTYVYIRFISKKLFPEYVEEQFLMMYGMLTGTASTGIILLREIDGDFKTPAADNLVYQNFPAIVFGFPMMFLATLAPKRPVLTLIIFVLFFAVLNIILFRSFILRKNGAKAADTQDDASDVK